MNERYPKRTVTVIDKKSLSKDLLRIFFRLEHTRNLPEKLWGRHIKLFPFGDDYKKSFTISSHKEDIISLDVMKHNGGASKWAQNVTIGTEAIIWGPKLEINKPMDINSKKVFLMSDLSGFSTMEYILNQLNRECIGAYYLKSSQELSFKNPTKVKVIQKDSFDLKKIISFLDESYDGYIIWGGEELKTINSLLAGKYKDKIKLKAYWK